MDSSNSFLRTVLDRVRFYLDETGADAKYTDSYIVDHLLSTSMVDILSRLNLTHGAQVVLSYDFTVESNITYYPLPPTVQEVVQLVTVGTDGYALADISPIDRMTRGGGWRLEGNPGSLVLVPTTNASDLDLRVLYVSNGDVHPHLGEGTLEENADGDHVITLDTSPTLGQLDRRPGAYAGQVLRIIHSGRPIEERTIESSAYDPDTGAYTVTVRRPFTYLPDELTSEDEPFTYEIAPAGSRALYEAIALFTALKLAVPLKVTESHYARLQQHYKAAIKTIGDNLTSIQTRRGSHIVKSTLDTQITTPIAFPIR